MHKIKNKIPIIALALILLMCAFLRLYRIDEYLTFLGDEGRDVLVVKRMIVDNKFTLLGPITSVGSMYMGPVYYYFMVPFLWLWNFSPVGPAIMVVIFSIATCFLVYKLGREFFDIRVGIFASLLYAISPLSIIYGRSSWNPNIVPFFSLAVIYSLLKVIVKEKYKYLIFAGVSLGILFQLHYVTFMFIPIVFFSLLLSRSKISLKHYFILLLSLIAGYLPFLLFELRHQFVNTRAVFRFLTTDGAVSQFSPLLILSKIENVVVRLFWRLIFVESAEVAKILIVFTFILIFLYIKKLKKGSSRRKAFNVLLVWFLSGVASFSLYQGIVYDYYFGSLWLTPFLLTSIAFYFLSTKGFFGKMTVFIALMLVIIFNFKNSPLKIPPSNLMENTRTIARFVFEKAKNKEYNFALIAGKNSDHAYRYFLEVWGNPPKVIDNPSKDPERTSVTKDLFVVCEEKVCQPLGHPLWEIAGFGRAEIVDKWNVATAKVFHLVHYEESEKLINE